MQRFLRDVQRNMRVIEPVECHRMKEHREEATRGSQMNSSFCGVMPTHFRAPGGDNLCDVLLFLASQLALT